MQPASGPQACAWGGAGPRPASNAEQRSSAGGEDEADCWARAVRRGECGPGAEENGSARATGLAGAAGLAGKKESGPWATSGIGGLTGLGCQQGLG